MNSAISAPTNARPIRIDLQINVHVLTNECADRRVYGTHCIGVWCVRTSTARRLTARPLTPDCVDRDESLARVVSPRPRANAHAIILNLHETVTDTGVHRHACMVRYVYRNDEGKRYGIDNVGHRVGRRFRSANAENVR